MLLDFNQWIEKKAEILVDYLDKNPIPAADAVEIVFPKLRGHSKLRIMRSLTTVWLKRKQKALNLNRKENI